LLRNFSLRHRRAGYAAQPSAQLPGRPPLRLLQPPRQPLQVRRSLRHADLIAEICVGTIVPAATRDYIGHAAFFAARKQCTVCSKAF
jgi:hypothetical protein